MVATTSEERWREAEQMNAAALRKSKTLALLREFERRRRQAVGRQG